MKKRVFSVSLILALVLSLAPVGVLAEEGYGAPNAPSDTELGVIYISAGGEDTNDGSSPDTPVKSWERAYELLEDGGTIVVMGAVEVRTESDPLPAKKATITGSYGGTDYDGKLIPVAETTRITHYFSVGADTTVENITVDCGEEEKTDDTFHFMANGHDLTIGENVETRPYPNGSYTPWPCINAGEVYEHGVSASFDHGGVITVKSGRWTGINAGSGYSIAGTKLYIYGGVTAEYLEANDATNATIHIVEGSEEQPTEIGSICIGNEDESVFDSLVVERGGYLQLTDDENWYGIPNVDAVKELVIQRGGTLEVTYPTLKGFSGDMTGGGRLILPSGGKLEIPGTITGETELEIIPERVAGEGYVEGCKLGVYVTAGGTSTGTFTLGNQIPAVLTKHAEGTQWTLTAKPFTLKPLELTKYMAVDHDHDKDNCFPVPRFEGIDEDTEIKVDGADWPADTDGSPYPFQIKYYPLPENYDLEDFPDGIEESYFDAAAPLDKDHEAGTYIARVVLNEGTELSEITIDGRQVETELSLLHIWEVEKLDQVGGDIDLLASPVTEEAPTQRVTEATAVIGPDVEYLVNNIEGQELNPEPDVRLLHDELVTSPGQDIYTDALIRRLEKEGVTQDGTRQYIMKYLDLIDANDSNLLVCAQSPYQIYIPYPAGTDQNTEFALYHFGGLNRTYTEQDYGENVFTNIENSKVTKFDIEKKPEGIVFTVKPPVKDRDNYSIGAMALTWAEKTTDPGPGGGEDQDDSYTLYYHSNFDKDRRWYQEEDDQRMVVRDYGDMSRLPRREGYVFLGWNTEADGSGEDYAPGDIYRLTRSTEHLYAMWERDSSGDSGAGRWLETREHRAFLSGYLDGTFGPDRPMTRAEVAQMFYSLLRDKGAARTARFTDVPADAWYARAVETLASLGMVEGYPDGTYRPDAPITRAEFAAIAMGFADEPGERRSIFSDVAWGDWYYDYVVGAAGYGWIGGYPDGTFRPHRNITRAEVSVIVDQMLGRQADETFLRRNAGELVSFWDLTRSHWGYDQIMEATNGHDYTKTGGAETWTGLLPGRI